MVVAFGGSFSGPIVGTARPGVCAGIEGSTWGMRDPHARVAFGGSLGFEAERSDDHLHALRLRARIGVARAFFTQSRPLLLRSLGVDAGPTVEYRPRASFSPGVGFELSTWGMFSFIGVALTGRTSTHELGALYASLFFRLGLPVFE